MIIEVVIRSKYTHLSENSIWEWNISAIFDIEKTIQKQNSFEFPMEFFWSGSNRDGECPIMVGAGEFENSKNLAFSAGPDEEIFRRYRKIL